MTTVDRPSAVGPIGGPLVGAFVQVALFGLLSIGWGLGPAGWLVGLAYTGVTFALLTSALRRTGARAFGPANCVTLLRATLVGCVTAYVADIDGVGRQLPVPVLLVVATIALAMDAVDGLVARRTRSATALGARFDMEVDAFLIFVLSVFVAGSLGSWVLAIGLLRYLFVAAGWVLPWLNRALPASYARKTVAAIQGVALVAGAGMLTRPIALVVVAAALVLLVLSFGRDVGWLWRRRITTV